MEKKVKRAAETDSEKETRHRCATRNQKDTDKMREETG